MFPKVLGKHYLIDDIPTPLSPTQHVYDYVTNTFILHLRKPTGKKKTPTKTKNKEIFRHLRHQNAPHIPHIQQQQQQRYTTTWSKIYAFSLCMHACQVAPPPVLPLISTYKLKDAALQPAHNNIQHSCSRQQKCNAIPKINYLNTFE